MMSVSHSASIRDFAAGMGSKLQMNTTLMATTNLQPLEKTITVKILTKLLRTTTVNPVTDLPDIRAILQRIRGRNRVQLLPPYMTSNHTYALGKTAGNKLLQTSNDPPLHSPIIYDVILKSILVLCVLIMVIVFAVRFFLWRRRSRRISYGPILESRTRFGAHSSRQRPWNMAEAENDNGHVGVSIPLIREVTRL